MAALALLVGAPFAALLAAGIFYVRLAAGPVHLPGLSERVGGAIASRLGEGWTAEVGEATLQLSGGWPALRAVRLDVRDPAGRLVVRAPHALVGLDPGAIALGGFGLRAVEFRDLQLRAILRADGSLAVRPSDDAEGPAPDPARAEPTPDRSAVAAAVASLLTPLLDPSSPIGALDRAIVRNARLTLVGPDGRERGVFPRLDAAFERAGEARRLSVDGTGPHGPWRLSGQAVEGSAPRLDLTAEAVPLADVAALAGFPAASVPKDLSLAGRVSAAFAAGRLETLGATLETTAGRIERAGAPPIRIDRLRAEAHWDETRRSLRIDDLSASVDGSSVRLAGDAAPAGPEAWRVALSGRDAVVSGLSAEDPSFRVDDVAFAATIDGAGAATVERLALKGEALDMAVSGVSAPGPGGRGVDLRLDVKGTDVRRLVRLWPDALAADLRRYLADNLRSGAVERLGLRAGLDGGRLADAFADRPLPDDALAVSFRLADAKLKVVDGLPPLRGLAVDGEVTGTRVKLASRAGRIELGEGRRLAFMDGTYEQADYDVKTSVAQIGFRVAGSADAVAAFLRTPLMKEANAPDLDPATVRGRAEFRVRIPLTVHRLPTLADLPLSLQGQLIEVSAEKAFGRERIEGANLQATFEAGAFALKGEARVAGSPATIDVSRGRNAAGDVTVNVTLDEAARARRSLPGPPALVGPVPVKVVASLADGGKGPFKIEADLSRAAVDGLLPGWVKPAGRPGRLAFTLADGEGADVRDLVLDAGPVQLKGHAVFGAAGQLEKADLSTLKLSPGDDLRAQVERVAGVYRITLKGANGDARPILRWVTGAPAAARTASAAAPSGRDGFDFDLDLAVAILSGHNDEALTGVVAKASSRAREVRSLQLNGRFKQAPVEISLAKRDAGAPVLSVSSGDAGATLKFLDLYRRMVGGRLAVDARSGEVSQDGRIEIDGFALKGEPALRSITAQGVQMERSVDGGLAPIARGEVDQVLFNKLQADFRRSASRVDFKDVVIWGSQVGFNLNGFVDLTRDRERMDVLGTFVPAYMLNNALSQVPVVGMLLGGPNEGLFAIDFRVTGSPAAPVLNVNPLTAVAPGILRKFLGWMMPGGAAPEATGTAPPRADDRSARPRAVPAPAPAAPSRADRDGG